MAVTLGADLKTTTAMRCLVLATIVMRVRASLPSVATASPPVTVALPPATAPAAVATISRRAVALASKEAAGHSSPRLREVRGGVWLGLGVAKGLPRRLLKRRFVWFFLSFPAPENETSMGPEGRVSNYGS